MAAIQNVQSIVAKSNTKKNFAILLTKFHNVAGARAFIGHWRQYTPTAAQAEKSGLLLHFFFSWPAITRLVDGRPGLDPSVGSDQLEPFFTDAEQGPDSLAMKAQLGFHEKSSPANWWDEAFSSRDIDLAIYCAFDDVEQQSSFLTLIRASAAENGIEELRLKSFSDGSLIGSRPENGRVHFGFRDGVTTPEIRWDDASSNGVNYREFILGYPSEDYPVSPVFPGPWQDFVRDGSFVGLTWIYQDVAAFNSFLKDNSHSMGGSSQVPEPEELLAARLIGRWRDGSALSLYPTAPPSAPDLSDNFTFADDPAGKKCPIASHIRLTNARDQPMHYRNQVRFPNGPPKLIRRGFTFGPPLEGTVDDSKERGLAGLFFFARINEQFYTVLRWMQQSEFSPSFDQFSNGQNLQDALTGSRAGANVNTGFTIQRDGGETNVTLRKFIEYRGVAVFFVPSMTALAEISAARH